MKESRKNTVLCWLSTACTVLSPLLIIPSPTVQYPPIYLPTSPPFTHRSLHEYSVLTPCTQRTPPTSTSPWGKIFLLFFLKKNPPIQQSPLTAQYHSVIDRYYRKFHPTQHPFPASKPVSHVQNARKHTHHLPTPTHHVQPSTQWGLAKSEKNETGKRLLPNAYAWWEGSQAGKQDTQIDVVDREVKGWKRKKIYRIPPPISCFLSVKVWNLLAKGPTLRTQLSTVQYLTAESKEKVNLSSPRGLFSTRKLFA